MTQTIKGRNKDETWSEVDVHDGRFLVDIGSQVEGVEDFSTEQLATVMLLTLDALERIQLQLSLLTGVKINEGERI